MYSCPGSCPSRPPSSSPTGDAKYVCNAPILSDFARARAHCTAESLILRWNLVSPSSPVPKGATSTLVYPQKIRHPPWLLCKLSEDFPGAYCGPDSPVNYL